ncbi:MAG: dihydrofolate reductase [Ornithinimicrobium sp.]
MSTPRFTVVPSVYLFLLREDPATGQPHVLLQVRRGTPYMDGWWACGAAGHVERGESAAAAAVREAAEELAIAIDPGDLEQVATLHRTCALDDPIEERIDLFFAVRQWEGEPSVAEPDKAEQLQWWPICKPPEHLGPHEAQALDVLRSGRGPRVLSRGFEQSLTLVAAVGTNGVIGDGAGMPWHLPDDLRHFKQVTSGGTMLRGRRTFDSIGSALPGRRSIVITRDPHWQADGVVVAHSMPEALLVAGDTEVFVIGGGEIYAQTIDVASRLEVTEVAQSPQEANAVLFPTIDPGRWRESERVEQDGFDFVTWCRR